MKGHVLTVLVCLKLRPLLCNNKVCLESNQNKIPLAQKKIQGINSSSAKNVTLQGGKGKTIECFKWCQLQTSVEVGVEPEFCQG